MICALAASGRSGRFSISVRLSRAKVTHFGQFFSTKAALELLRVALRVLPAPGFVITAVADQPLVQVTGSLLCDFADLDVPVGYHQTVCTYAGRGGRVRSFVYVPNRCAPASANRLSAVRPYSPYPLGSLRSKVRSSR
jgi:hypothetical protein